MIKVIAMKTVSLGKNQPTIITN